MRYPVLIVASVAALLTFGGSGSANAQQPSDSGQAVPDAPQPQKKPASKPQSSDSSTKPTDKPDSTPKATKDENPFPEAVSREAAKAASDGSPDAGTASPTPKPSTKDDNPFPESVSRDAAKAAGNDSSPAPAAKPDLPPGVSSSRSRGTFDSGDEVSDPARAKKDSEVAGFYMKTGDYQGALLRYKDAMTADPTNVEAIFGLAETQRMLKKNAEAAQNYQLYLNIVPNGPKAKQALKALKSLGAGG